MPMNAQELLHTGSTIFSFVAAAIVLYVSYRLATFESNFLERLNGRYVGRKEHDLIKESHDKDHQRYERDFDQVWSAVNKLREP